MPFEFGVDTLLSRGWDEALQRAEHVVTMGVAPDLSAVSLIEALVAVDRRGEGLSGSLLAEAPSPGG